MYCIPKEMLATSSQTRASDVQNLRASRGRVTLELRKCVTSFVNVNRGI